MFVFPGNDWNETQHGAWEHSCVEDNIHFLHLGGEDPGVLILCKLIVISIILLLIYFYFYILVICFGREHAHT